MRHARGIDLLAAIPPAHYQEPSTAVRDTVSGLRNWEVLGAKCGKCGRTAWLDRSKVMRRYGDQCLQDIGAKLVCRCGNRQGNKVLVGTLGRD